MTPHHYEDLALSRYTVAELKQAYTILSERYRSQKRHSGIKSEMEALSYALARMPATMAVMNYVMNATLDRVSFEFKSILDLGAGTGAGLWVMKDHFPNAALHAIEQDKHMISLLKTTGAKISNESILKAQLPVVDCMILSYVLGEMDAAKITNLMQKIAITSPKVIIITSPGTVQDYQDLMVARQKLIELGYSIIAPCPHNGVCPLTNTKDWCHFSVRFKRSKLHKLIKGGSLPYEDEKFSYIVATKEPIANETNSRIIKNPIRNKGHVILDLCTSDGIVRKTIGKSDPHYKRAHKADWGEAI